MTQKHISEGVEFTAPSVRHYLESQFGAAHSIVGGFRDEVVSVTFERNPVLVTPSPHDATSCQIFPLSGVGNDLEGALISAFASMNAHLQKDGASIAVLTPDADKVSYTLGRPSHMGFQGRDVLLYPDYGMNFKIVEPA